MEINLNTALEATKEGAVMFPTKESYSREEVLKLLDLLRISIRCVLREKAV